MKGDGAAFGGDAVGGGEDVAVFMPQQQAVEHGNGHRHQQHRHGGREAHSAGVKGHLAFQREALGIDAQNGVLADFGQNDKEIHHRNGVGKHGGHCGTGHIHAKAKRHGQGAVEQCIPPFRR